MDAVNNSSKQRGRPFQPGVSGNARGRPIGARNKRTRAALEAAEAGGDMPLDYMLTVMRDPKVDGKRRDAMAIAAAPYLHPKLSSVEPQPFTDPDNPEGVSRIEVSFVSPSRGEDDDEKGRP
jgi:hypothetical protein